MRPSRGRTAESMSIRLTAEERAKLDRLAEATGRYPSQVLRLLVQYAELAERPDIELKTLEVGT
jgi:predicted transcriptional regulator